MTSDTPVTGTPAAPTGPHENTLARAEALRALGRYAQASALIAAHLADHPADADAWTRLAWCRSALHDPPGALEAADEALRHDPTRPGPWRARCDALLDLHRPQDAAAAAEESLRLAPDDWISHYEHARVLAELPGRAQDAYTAAVHATILAPAEPDAHFLVGQIAADHLGPGWGPVTERAFSTALQLDPQHAPAHNALALTKISQAAAGKVANISGIADHLAAALAADPQQPAARHNLRVVVLLLLRRARLLAFATLAGAMACRAVTEPGPLAPTGWALHGAGLLALITVWTCWPLHLRRRLPPSLRRPLVQTVTGSLYLAGIAAPIGLAVLVGVAILTVPPSAGPPTTGDADDIISSAFLATAALVFFSPALLQRFR